MEKRESLKTKKQQQERVTEIAGRIPREIKTEKHAGAGGRMRTVAICEASCWHGSWAQAVKCKSAHWVIAGDQLRDEMTR